MEKIKNKSRYEYYCEYYHITNKLPTNKQLARFILFGIIGD